MTNHFLPKALSITAKEKGFNDHCFGYYDINEDAFHTAFTVDEEGAITTLTYEDFEQIDLPHIILAPTYWQIIVWFKANNIRITESPHEPDLCTITISERSHILGRYALNEAIGRAFKHVHKKRTRPL